MPALRWVFLAGVALFAWRGLHGRWREVGDALHDTPITGVLAAFALVLIGLFATGLLWIRLMAWFDATLPFVDGMGTFFVGQLGKYIPGSVWSIGAQAELARRHSVPARATVGAGLLFLGYHVDTAVLIAATTFLAGGLESPWPDSVTWVALVAALVGLVPALVCRLGRQVAGRRLRVGWAQTMTVVSLMAVAWAAYAWALVLLAPDVPVGQLVALGGAFSASYAVGVVVVFAPAGVGAREAIFVLLLTPVTGVGAATALALLARVVHTAADAVMAAGWWFASRRVTAR
jgi:uncharacterized membrane protein YbhN (UPF0104 family)